MSPTRPRTCKPAAGLVDRSDTYAVIGAGSSGLAATKNLHRQGFPVVCFEREDDIGGNWNFGKPHSRVYASTHTISSKPFTQYPDFPMPDSFPDYPHHSQLLAYFQAYADHFGLREHIRFATTVERVEPYDGGRLWDVRVTNPDGTSETGRHAGVVIANGHNWDPKIPGYEGLDTFTGEVVHSADYKGPDPLRGRRVLVVGAGNTGCDIAVEAAQNAAHAWHSTRRGYWYAPKYLGGKPSDQVADLMLGLRLPLRVRQWMLSLTLKSMVGDVTRFGLKKPDHKFLQTHPIVNSNLLYYVGHGDITPKPDIASVDGARVRFVDGTEVEPDVIVLATGYLVRFDFLDHAHLNWRGDRPHLYQHVFHPEYDNLFVAGLIQPDSGQFTLAHWQTMAIGEYLLARRDRPELAARFRELVRADVEHAYDAGAHYTDSTRHYFEVAHLHYLAGLERDINLLEGAA